jgi:hypothetical protein
MKQETNDKTIKFLSDDDKMYDLFRRAYELMITYPKDSEQYATAVKFKKDFGDKWRR